MVLDMKKLENRRFFAFDVAVIDIDTIIAVINHQQQIATAGEPIVIPVITVMLDTGSSTTLAGDAMDTFVFWMKENASIEKVKLPEPPAAEAVVEIETTPVAVAAPVVPTPFDTPPAPPVSAPVVMPPSAFDPSEPTSDEPVSIE